MVELIAFLATRHWTSLNLMKKHATLLLSLMNIIFLMRLVLLLLLGIECIYLRTPRQYQSNSSKVWCKSLFWANLSILMVVLQLMVMAFVYFAIQSFLSNMICIYMCIPFIYINLKILVDVLFGKCPRMTLMLSCQLRRNKCLISYMSELSVV